MLFAIVLAWRNLRQGRADRRGAMRVGLFVFIFDSLYWLLATHHVADSELLMIQTRIGFQLRVAGEVWLLYVALEPHARRLWPDVLISWSRLVAGRLRDPRIGRDILVGAAVGLFGAYVEYLTHRVDGALGAASAMPDLPSGRGLAKGRQVLGGIFDMVPDALNVPFFILLLLLLLRLVLRNRFAAVAALFAIGTVLSVPGESESQIVAWTGAAFIVGLMVTVLIRFGILALVAGGLYNGLDRLVLTSDLSVWYAGRSVLAVVVFVSLATYALVIALRGRRLFSESLLDG
jgi:serine/threonine-protein kinase